MREAHFKGSIKDTEDFIGLAVTDMKTEEFAIFGSGEGLEGSLESKEDGPG